MIQVMTIRQQIELALKRVPNLDTFLLNQLRIELHREFGPDAVAIGPSESFESLAAILGYVKLAPDAILTTQAEMECIKRQFAELEARLEPGKVQVSRLKLENWLRRIQHIKQLACNENRVSTLGIADNLAAELTAALEAENGQGGAAT